MLLVEPGGYQGSGIGDRQGGGGPPEGGARGRYGGAHLLELLGVAGAAAGMLVELAAARRVHAGGAEQAAVAPCELQCGPGLGESACGDDDLLHPGRPCSLQHCVQVWLVVLLSMVLSLVHRVQ